MKIILKSMILVNFKGIRDLRFEFRPDRNTVYGRNGVGKTTLFDAFTWVLFGKDSKDRSDSNFTLKTLGKDRKPILHLPHSVTCVLDVDGKELTLERRYQEVWEKQSCTTQEVLKNHKTVFLINGVKQATKRDYDAFVSSLISENIFRMITNPYFFNKQPADVQRSMLIELAGNVTDEDIALKSPEFSAFLSALDGTDMAVKAKEIAQRKSACKQELKLIPSKIETAEKLKPALEDWDALDTELAGLRKELSDIDSLILNDKSSQQRDLYETRNGLLETINAKKLERTERLNNLRQTADQTYNEALRKAEEEAGRRREEISNAISGKETERLNRERLIRQIAGKAYAEALERVSEIDREINAKTAELHAQKHQRDLLANDMSDAQVRLDNTSKTITEKSVEIDKCRAEYQEIWKSQVTFDPASFICPMCKRPLEAEDVEAKRAELEANFNARKAGLIKANVERGKAIRSQLDMLTGTREILKQQILQQQRAYKENEIIQKQNEADLKELQARMVSAKADVPESPDYDRELSADKIYQEILSDLADFKKDYDAVKAQPVVKPDHDAIGQADAQVIRLTNEITELQNQLDALSDLQTDLLDLSDLDRQKTEINDRIDALNRRMGKKETIQHAQEEIAALETQRDNMNAELADLESWEFQALQFQKAKNDELQKRINGLFNLVEFSFVDTQLNGNETISCVCSVEGVPYPMLNDAAQINAGLDIINAICRSKNVSAPIFIDRTESVNEVMPTESQSVLLCATLDPILIIK